MQTKTIWKDDRTHVVAFFVNDRLLYTRTYILDNEGFVDRNVMVMADDASILVDGKKIKA